MSTEIASPAVERVSNSVPQLVQCTRVVVYSGCIPVFTKTPPCAVKFALSTYSTTLVKGVEKEVARGSCDLLEKNVLAADALQLAQELCVGARLFELLYKKLYLLVAVECAQDAANLPHPLSLRRLHE